MRRRATLLSLAVAGALAAPALGQEPPRASPAPLVLGLAPEVNVFEQRARFAALGDYLGKRVGVPVRFTILASHGEVLARLRGGGLDGAFVGSLAGAVAVERLRAVPVARSVNRDGTSSAHGYLFVRKDSGIHDPPSMLGKRMAFVDRATTAGYTFPLAWLRERGVASPARFFGEAWFAGSHDAAIHAVLERRADVGAAKDGVYDGLRARDPRIDRDLLILASSPAVPSSGLCVREGLDPRLREALRAALLGLEGDPEGAAALRGIGALRFVETRAEDYAPALALARKAGVDPRQWRAVGGGE
jgi:phosphonate transport system substrate-binding protein